MITVTWTLCDNPQCAASYTKTHLYDTSAFHLPRREDVLTVAPGLYAEVGRAVWNMDLDEVEVECYLNWLAEHHVALLSAGWERCEKGK